ncbi:MAG: hypothetical protein HBSAPP03_09110 [Phycisphaerae bacterium]|nr:MAG: hypothetical protein HBSAPP03_09110 [Phycisphaerae bacterium]
MHVALYEPNSSGHRYTHVKRLLPVLAGLGAKVTFVTSRQGRESQEYAAQVQGVEHLCDVESSMEFDEKAPVKANVKRMAEHLRRVVNDLGADHVLMPYADGTIQTAGMMRVTGRFSVPRGVEVEGLMMRGLFAYQEGGGLRAALRTKAWLALTAAAPFSTIHHMDPIVVRAMRRRAPGLARRVRLIPDPVEPFDAPTRLEARRRLGIPEDGRYIGCVGFQDRRKGIDRLIRAFLDASLGTNDRLLLAGKQEPQIRDMLAGEAAGAVAAGRIISLARYISDEELCLGVSAMDVVCTPYPPDAGHSGSSSIVIHAAGQARPSLGSDCGWVGDTIRRFGLGWVTDVMNPGVFASAVRTAMDQAGAFRLTEGGRRFVEFHRPDNFGACFAKRLRERLNLPPVQGLREWSWVEEAAEPVGPSARPDSGR